MKTIFLQKKTFGSSFSPSFELFLSFEKKNSNVSPSLASQTFSPVKKNIVDQRLKEDNEEELKTRSRKMQKMARPLEAAKDHCQEVARDNTSYSSTDV